MFSLSLAPLAANLGDIATTLALRSNRLHTLCPLACTTLPPALLIPLSLLDLPRGTPHAPPYLFAPLFATRLVLPLFAAFGILLSFSSRSLRAGRSATP